MGNERVEMRAALGGKNRGHGFSIGRIRAQPIDGLSWQTHQLTARKGGGGSSGRFQKRLIHGLSCDSLGLKVKNRAQQRRFDHEKVTLTST